MHDPIRIFVADDHPVTRFAVRLAVSDKTDFQFCGESDDPATLMTKLDGLPVDVLITDVSMPSRLARDGLAMLQRLHARFPALRIVVLSTHDSPALIRGAMAAGVTGFVHKRDAPVHVPDAIRALMQGDYYLAPGIRSVCEAASRRRQRSSQQRERAILPVSESVVLSPAQGPVAQRTAIFGEDTLTVSLTEREADVVRRYLAGASLNAIARALGRSVKTVSAQRSAAMRKLWAENDAQLFEFASLNGDYLWH